ncbi:ead/Ea22-like family protein [Variovorax paradoxus]|uniref:ead/Ea22-like family protein n=1 Tax=Variovorax paradoxus TaxID=34073 RepID=UPI0019342C15|nr:ead/Ea22-like family protein [Variovorax paradoxus]
MTTDIHAAMQAIREALAAGPTPGPWIAGDDEDSDFLLVGPEEYPGLVCRPVVSLHAERDARFIAACNPEAITTILAALEARDAEIAALREDAERPKLTAAQCTDLLIAAFYISARDDETAVLKDEDAERIVDLLYDLSTINLDATTDQPKPSPRYPSTEGQRIARQIREGKEGKEKP